ncbi:MAG: hypothetical protein AAF514_14310 [Verrucomicrobiota bacterium]
MKRLFFLFVGLVCVALSGTVRGQTVTVLDSFEDNVDGMEVLGGNGRSAEDITLSQHSKVDAEDVRVTHGEKALKISLGGSPAWNPDALYTFSEENSRLIKEAWATRAEARYILRWDVTFPEELNWGNNIVQLNGNWRYGQCEYGGQISRTNSIPLDLVDRDLVNEDRITLRMLHNFGVDDFQGLDLYIDHIRLVDMYSDGAVPVTTVLQGFEDQTAVDTIIPLTERYELSLKEKVGGEVAVTEGERSLEITMKERGMWKQDFTIPLGGTLMDTIARLPPGARSRYTLRLDVIFGEVGDGWTGNWQNFNIRPGGGGTSASNHSIYRVQNEAHVRTYSLTMDQLELGTDEPGIRIVSQGAWGDAGAVFHLDNLRVVDTGNAPLKISGIDVSPAGEVSVRWKSSESQAYTLEASTDLLTWQEMATGLVGQPDEMTYTSEPGAITGQRYFRVRLAGAAPPLNEGFENGLGSWRSVTRAGTGATEWEVGTPLDPPGVRTGNGVAGTDLDADYETGTHVSLISPEVNLEPFLSGPMLHFYYHLAFCDGGALRVILLEANESLLEEA